MPQEMEAEVEKCNSMKALRAVAERNRSFKETSLDAIAPVKIVLTNIANRLELKGKKFHTYTVTSAQELDDLWTALLTIDEEFSHSRKDNFSAKELSQKLVRFIEHSCIQQHCIKFSEVFGTKTSGEHKPSSKKKSSKDKSLAFSASIQHVKNIDMILF